MHKEKPHDSSGRGACMYVVLLLVPPWSTYIILCTYVHTDTSDLDRPNGGHLDSCAPPYCWKKNNLETKLLKFSENHRKSHPAPHTQQNIYFGDWNTKLQYQKCTWPASWSLICTKMRGKKVHFTPLAQVANRVSRTQVSEIESITSVT